MTIIRDGIRSYSKLTYSEYVNSVKNSIDNLSPQEKEVFLRLIDDPGVPFFSDPELELKALELEYDRPCVDIQQWLEDPFYMGESAKSLFPCWKRDLIELFSSRQYIYGCIVGSLGCVDESTKLVTSEGIQAIGDIKQSTEFLTYDGTKTLFLPSIGPFPKGKGDLYQVVTEHSEFVAYGPHLIFCSDRKYRRVEELQCGDALFWSNEAASFFLPGSSAVPCAPYNTSTTNTTIKHTSVVKRDQWYWDLQIPHTNCYFHDGGFLSHNSGKSTFVQYVVTRMLYEASCLRSPQKSYGIAPGSKIGICNLAPSKEVAREIIFEGVIGLIKASPYFMTNMFPIYKGDKTLSNVKSYQIDFPKNLFLIAGSSTNTSYIGLNLIGGVIEEINFFASNPKHMKGRGDKWGDFSKAGSLFGNIMRRMKSRFSRKGKLPGILLGISSKTTEDSITEKFIEEAHKSNDPHFFLRDRAVIDVRADQFSSKKFRVLIGGQFYHSRILFDDEDISDFENPRIVEVPEDLKKDFENDIEQALRELAGISTKAFHTFFTKSEKIHESIDVTRKHPFKCWAMPNPDWWDSRSFYTMDWGSLACRNDRGEWEPTLNPHAKRYVHLDPAVSGDAFGLAIVHISGHTEVERLTPAIPVAGGELAGDVIRELQPHYCVDFVLRIVGSKEAEILFRNVRKILYEFTEHGFHLAKITSDKFQSKEMLQQLESQGYTTDIVSVDEEHEAYLCLRRAVYDGRVRFYHYQKLIDELMKLEDFGGKVDHPQAGCFVGETRIPLLDGTCPMISELDGKTAWVYSCRPDGIIVPGLAKGRKTKYTKRLVDVILDSGAVVRCTPEHPWMLRDGSYVQAQRIIPNKDRLMPISFQFPVNGGYERIGNLTNNRLLTHHMVIKGLGGKVPDGFIVHHVNGVKTDNRPENLVVECKKEHGRYHTTARYVNDIGYREKVKNGLQRFNLSEEGRRKHSLSLKKTMSGLSEKDFIERARNNSGFRKDITIKDLERAKEEIDVWNSNSAARFLKCGRNVVVRVLQEHGFSNWAQFEEAVSSNHKVRSIVPVELEVEVPVYDLEVSHWDNFALSAGVFVHNSKDVADALCGAIWTLFEDGGYSEPVMPLKGASVASEQFQATDENFIPIEQKAGDAGVVVVTSSKPQKQKTLSPSYRKVNPEGKETAVFDPDLWIMRG